MRDFERRDNESWRDVVLSLASLASRVKRPEADRNKVGVIVWPVCLGAGGDSGNDVPPGFIVAAFEVTHLQSSPSQL